MRPTRSIPTLARVCTALLVTALAFGGAAADDDARTRRDRQEYEQRRKELLVEAGTAHAKVGVWCRDAGMVAQASAEFLRAVEVSEGENAWAQRILALMRNLDDRFWKGRLEKPSAGMIRAYEKRARKARRDYQRDRLRLAKWADKKDLQDEAYEEYKTVVRMSDDRIQVDEDGVVVLEVGKLPEAYSERLLADAVQVNGRPMVRDEFLEKVPQVKDVFEAQNDEVVMRSQLGLEHAQSLLALCTALLPHLEADLGGRPTRRLRMFVFADRATYEAYCEAAGLGSHKAAAGLADSGAWVTLVCAEGHDAATVQGIALHEMTHLFQYGVSPTVMPSWYNEGFAETYGGEGTWSWDGTTMTCGGSMDATRIRSLAADGTWIPLERLLKGDALTLINENRTSARDFYDASWAFFRFLRTAAGGDVAERFARYELVCRGAALGAEAGKPHNRDASDAAGYFQRMFGGDLPALEKAFRAWLADYGA